MNARATINPAMRISHPAPAIPAVSATFVYEDLSAQRESTITGKQP